MPERYFSSQARKLAEIYLRDAVAASDQQQVLPDSLEKEIEPLLENTWGDTAKAIFNNWLGLVYATTNIDRTQQFMPGIDPDNPLGL